MLDHEDHHWWYRGRRRIVIDTIDRLELPTDRPPRLLDAGCGSGRMLDELAARGNASGLDLNPDSVALARGRGHDDVREGHVETLPWPDETFDLVTCLDVVEHTGDDRVTLRELRRVTRPGGHAIVTVPAYQALWSNHDVLNRHYRRYGRRTFRIAASDAGWEIEWMTFFNSILLAPASTVRLVQRARRESVEEHTSDVGIAPRWMYPALEMPLHAEAAWLRRGRTLPAGLSLLALLRR